MAIFVPADDQILGASSAIARAVALEELRQAVALVIEHVSGFLAGSEKVFLETGASLKQLRDQALSVVSTSTAVVDGARPGGEDPVERLSRGFRHIDAHIADSGRALAFKADKLRGILAAIQRLVPFRYLFRRVSSGLRTVSMSTGVENARIGAETTGFATVAADVHHFGALVEVKLDGVFGEAQLMSQTARDALARIDALLSHQGQRETTILADATSGLESLNALGRSAAEVGRKTSEVSQRVVESVTSVVVSLQVHDMARQIIEHALEGLREVEAELLAERGAGGAAVAEPLDPGEVAGFCRLQGSQLREARSRLEQAVRGMPASLKVMSAAARDLADAARRLTDRPQGGSLLVAIEQGVVHAVATLREQLRQQADIDTAMERVAGTVGGMLKSLRDVEEIGETLKIVGLNAGLAATNSTSGSKVFAVLARSIEELSTEVGTHTTPFAAVVNEIARGASSTKEGGEGASEPTAGVASGERIAQELEGLLGNVRSYDQHLGAAIESMMSTVGALGREVDTTVGRILGRKDSDALEAAEAQLEAASAAVSVLAEQERGERGVTVHRRMRASARYTVELEREIHRSLEESAPPPMTPAKHPVARGRVAVAATPPPPKSDLGDNVELF